MENELTRRTVLAGAAAGAAGTVALGAAGSAAAAKGVRSKAADTVVVNAQVLVLDPRFRKAKALAIRNGKIVATGDSREIKRLAGRRTEVIDAGGGTVLPGINDSHLHLSGFALTLPPLSYNVDTATIEALRDVVRGAVAQAGTPTEWIRGQGWNDNRLPKAPDRHDLDAVSGDHPVILTDFSFHAVAVNSKALQLAGITRDTQPPVGGVIERDENGEPTGVFRETAQGLVARVVPALTRAQIERGVAVSIETLHSLGITSVTDPGISPQTLAMYADLARARQLPIRVNALLSGGTSVASIRAAIESYRPLRNVDERRLRVAGLKIFADGIPTAAQTAWLREPYLDGTNGSLVIDGSTPREQVATLHRMIAIAHRRGFQVGTHATGDATINAVVAGYLAALKSTRRDRDLRHYVIHGDLTPEATLRTMAKHDIGVNMNGTIKYLLGRTLDPVLGPERTDYQWPYRTAMRAGVRVSSSSDAPVTFPSWLQGVMAMRLREGMFGGVAGAEERISLRRALSTYTRNPAHQDQAATWKGTLQEGYVADLCILDGDLTRTHPREIVGLGIAGTLLGGRVVHDATTTVARAARARGGQRALSLSSHTSEACLSEGLCCCALTERLGG